MTHYIILHHFPFYINNSFHYKAKQLLVFWEPALVVFNRGFIRRWKTQKIKCRIRSRFKIGAAENKKKLTQILQYYNFVRTYLAGQFIHKSMPQTKAQIAFKLTVLNKHCKLFDIKK